MIRFDVPGQRRLGSPPRPWLRSCLQACLFCAVAGWLAPGRAQDAPAAPAPPQRWNDWPGGADDAGRLQRRSIAIMLGGSLAVAAYGKRNWWRDGFTGRFQSVDEGMFGQRTYSGGADKLGHMYMNYAGTRLLARLFEWDGNAPALSLRTAAWYSLGTFAAVEVLDGFSRRWRFSKEDMLMNAAGVGAALLMEANPRLDSLLDLRFQYRPSREGGARADPFGDYSGQTYLVVAKASGVPALRADPLLRYAELAIGYGTRGYTSGSDRPRTRNVYIGVSLNLSALLERPAFGDAAAARLARTMLEFVQVPGTAALARHTLPTD